ncbi:hypothetical protein Ancab_038362 [Ancistrocladus abbreviatus]
MVKSGEQVIWAANGGNSRKLPGDAAGSLCGLGLGLGLGLVFDVVGLLETCEPNPPSKLEKACRPASQKSDSLNMKSKRIASSKCKSYRIRGEALMGLSTTRGKDGTSVLVISAAMNGLSLLKEPDSVVPSSIVAMKGPFLPREFDSEVAEQIWGLGKDLGAIFFGEDREVMNLIKEMETRIIELRKSHTRQS